MEKFVRNNLTLVLRTWVGDEELRPQLLWTVAYKEHLAGLNTLIRTQSGVLEAFLTTQ